MKPKFIFTLDGDLGPYQISEPEGWAKIIFNLERDLTYWSLIENFEVPLIFYGTAEGKDGGYQYLSTAKANGINTLVTIEIAISFDGDITSEICFDGRIDLSTAKEIVYRAKIEAAIVRNDLWAIFMAKKSTPVNILASTDIYGNSRLAINRQELKLTSQKVFQAYEGHVDRDVTTSYTIPDNQYGQIDFAQELVSEIEEKFTYPLEENSQRPFELFAAKYGGNYAFDVKIYTSTAAILGASTDPALEVRIQINDNAATVLTQTNESSGLESWTKHTYSGTVALNPNDNVYLYFYNNNAPGASYTFVWFAGLLHDSRLIVNADTVYLDTQCDSVLLFDAALSICEGILKENNSFDSTFFGGDKTTIHYATNGCGYLNAISRGVNIRGYSFDEKPITLSFDDWWNGVNPVFNLGLGYETLSGSPAVKVIEVEQKSEFFNQIPSVYLTGINDILIDYDLNLFTKTIEIGFEQWQAESSSGLDDPQTKHTYSTLFELFGKDEKQLSKFIAASLAIEQGRRLTKIQNNDWRLDENIFLFALGTQNSSGSSPAAVTEYLELGSAFTISGLRNPETRYNVRHTPARMLQRWLSFYSGQLQDYLTESFKFRSGEGNIQMGWAGDLVAPICDSGTLFENADQSVSSSYLFLPIVYSFTHPLTWDDYRTIRNNRKNAISISWIDPQGATQTKIAFIKKLGYDINKSKANFEVWIRS